jgi:hypothetical protein
VADTQRALKAPPAYSELAGSVRWLRANPILAAGVLLIAAQLWWQAGLLGRSFFRLDDYIYLEHASSSGLTWSYLTWVDAGHLDVVGSAIVWALVRISPEDWTLASAATLVLLGCTGVALLRMLRALFGDRPGILLLLSLYLLSPLALPGLSWWTVTLELLPLQLALFCAVTAHVHYLRTGGLKHVAAAAAWLAVGMLSSFQGAAVPFLLFALTSAFFARGAWSRALWPALREHWRTWTLYLGLTAGYVVLYLFRLRTSSAGLTKPATFADSLTFAGTLLRDTFVPGAFGGPWRWASSGVEALADPPPALAWASWVLAVIVVLASLMYGWRAWRAWAILAGWLIVVDVVPVLAGRSSLVSVVVLGLSARYVWDAAGILVLCAGLAFMPLADGPSRWQTPRRLSRPEFAAATTLVAAIVVGSLWSFYDYPTDPAAAEAASYIATARVALADAPSGAVIVDDPTPVGVTGGFFGPVTNAAAVLSPLPFGSPGSPGSPGSRPVFITQPDGTYDHLLEFDGFGRLVPAGIYGASSPPVPAGGACWADTFGDVAVPLTAVAANASTLRIGYLAGSPAQVLITFGTRSALYSVERGLHAVYFPISGDNVGTVVIQQVSGLVPCIGNVQAGVLLPSEAGPAIPPFALAG